jgi:NitT/TauT family transport system permease protein
MIVHSGSSLLIPERRFPVVLDALAALLVLAVVITLALGSIGTFASLATVTRRPISLDPIQLPYYAVRTVLRMLAAMVASLLFTLTYGTVAAKSRRAEPVLIPLLDILQSVPVLGYLSFTVVFFMSLFPGRALGAELAAVFAIFTSQAWNMTFSFYQALRTVPRDLDEASRAFRFSAWQRFWRLEVPFSVPGLVWNMMMSMSGGWFFVVASEAISVGQHQVALPGVGSYVALAIEQENLAAIGWAIVTMIIVIIIYDQLLFRPLVVWADTFRFEQTAREAPQSWFLQLMRRSRIIHAMSQPISFSLHHLIRARFLNVRIRTARRRVVSSRLLDIVWYAVVAVAVLWATNVIVRFVVDELHWTDVATVFRLGLYTLLRVAVLVLLASALWVPLGVMIGLRPKISQHVQPLAQFLAAFPANLLFPVAVALILRWRLNPDVWLSPLMILGTQWYILFNVIAGATAYPTDLLEAASEFRFRPWQWWRRAVLPGIFPYFVTGAITASGGAWNASIVAEVVSWGHTQLVAHGLGAYIAQTTSAGDYPRIVLGVAVMSLLVIAFNRGLWRPLYAYGEQHLRLD